MLIKVPRGWEISEGEVTPERVYLDRRKFLAGASAALAGMGSLVVPGGDGLARGRPDLKDRSSARLLPLSAPRKAEYQVDHPITAEPVATRFNNYYEFTETKARVWKLAEEFDSRPWQIEIRGLVQKPRTIDVDDLIRQMSLEERVYRLRCVEAWTMFIPWIGFPMQKFVEWCAPLSNARYVRMVSFYRPAQAEGQRRASRYRWPYHEVLTLAEATNELALLVVGMYGKTLPNQNGAPLRLHVPWKYGFKSIKAITKFEFTDQQPATFWNATVPAEYDFLANVDPSKPHPRWSQAHEQLVETGEVVPSRLYNGYEKYVASLYK
jgi:sulfoxide reductase catalytic subunit YedY